MELEGQCVATPYGDIKVTVQVREQAARLPPCLCTVELALHPVPLDTSSLAGMCVAVTLPVVRFVSLTLPPAHLRALPLLTGRGTAASQPS